VKHMNKTIKRLLIYLGFSFVPIILLMTLISSFVTKNIFVYRGLIVENDDQTAMYYGAVVYAVGIFAMMVPSVAHILTRLITREGFHDLYLWGPWKGKIKYFIMSALVPLGIALMEYILLWRMYAPELGVEEAFGNPMAIPNLLLQFATTILVVIAAFGEEWGWRGYMMPKLTELMGKPMAVLVGGIIWGLWHAPMTINGHNFGVDYPGFPYLGILLMCLFCISMNAFLTFLTERTGTIYAASLSHMVNNNLGSGVLMMLFSSEKFMDRMVAGGPTSIKMFLIMIPFQAIIAVVSLVLLMKKQPIGE